MKVNGALPRFLFQQCNPHDKESDYWSGGRGAKQGYEVSQPVAHILTESPEFPRARANST